MYFQSLGGYISADLFSSFFMEVLLVVLCYWAISSLRVTVRASGGKRQGSSEKCGAESSACSPQHPQLEETAVPYAKVDSSRGADGGSLVAAAGKAPGGASKLHHKEAACIADVCSALKTKNWSQVMEIIYDMYQQEICPSASFYSHVMLMAKWGKQWEIVVAAFLLMQAHGVPPWVSAWKLYCTAADYVQSRTEERRCSEEQHRASLKERGFKNEVNTYRFMIFIYGIETTHYPDFSRLQELQGELQKAKLCLTTSTYNAMLAACQAPLRFGFAINIFMAMQRCGCVPDIFTLTVLVRICARQAGASSGDRGRQFLLQLLNEHFKPDLTHAHAALDALKGERDWTVALDILESMKHHGIAVHAETYKRAIKGFQASRQFDYAIQVAKECLTRCTRLESLDVPFYSSLLTCCAECNNSDSAIFFFGEMQRYHAPGVEEYKALLQCLLKCNCEADAKEVLVKIGFAGVEKENQTEGILAMRVTTGSQ